MTDHDAVVQVFHAEPGWVFPPLLGKALPDGGRVDLATEQTIWTVYDTVDGDLERFGALLARSASGQWRLRVDGRVHTASDPGRAVPIELRELLTGVRIGGALRPVRRIAGERTTRVIVNADDQLLGEIDDVAQQLLDDEGGTSQLPHLVELIAVDPAFGDAITKKLVKAGAVRLPACDSHDRKAQTVAQAVQAFLTEQLHTILQGDLRLRQGEDVVHPTRVAIRRIRSVLRVVDVFDASRAAALDADLRWLAGLLGDVRDLDVLRRHLAKSLHRVATPEAGFPTEPTRAAVEAALDRRAQAAQDALRTAMRGRRYLSVLRELRTWADDAPLAVGADGGVRRLAGHAHAARKKMKKRLAQAHDIESAHRARRAAKRARYVAEFVAGSLPSARAKLADQAKAAQRVQSSLGKKQDAAVATAFLAELVRSPVRRTTARGVPADQLDPAAAFGVGVLWAYERRHTA